MKKNSLFSAKKRKAHYKVVNNVNKTVNKYNKAGNRLAKVRK